MVSLCLISHDVIFPATFLISTDFWCSLPKPAPAFRNGVLVRLDPRIKTQKKPPFKNRSSCVGTQPTKRIQQGLLTKVLELNTFHICSRFHSAWHQYMSPKKKDRKTEDAMEYNNHITNSSHLKGLKKNNPSITFK